MLTFNFRKLTPDAKAPTKANSDDLGIDIYSNQYVVLSPGDVTPIKTGIAIQTPENYGLVLKTRSGMAVGGLDVRGGVVDPGYRGEIKVILANTSKSAYVVNVGDKIAQGIMTRVIDVVIMEAEELDESPRGDKGFGSSGK
jgi:dUTP pyrophosphatase